MKNDPIDQDWHVNKSKTGMKIACLTGSRYWAQRFDIFSLYNQGIWTTDNSWFEVTPEAIAKFVLPVSPPTRTDRAYSKIAEHVTSAIPDNRSIIVDAFCGIGGNAIAFARSGKFKRVYAIEKDEAALACAKHNAEIYGVSNSITWFQGDCFEILGVDENLKQNAVSALKEVIGQYGVIFASPPWGGMYSDASCVQVLTPLRAWLQK